MLMKTSGAPTQAGRFPGGAKSILWSSRQDRSTRNRSAIRSDIEVGALRCHVRLEADGRVASRLMAIANALFGMSRLVAAEVAGMDRQVVRY